MKKGSLGQSVYQYLLDQILMGNIKPGDRIPETKIANELGISRTPIRDALKQLANDGIVEIYPNRFVKVAHWDDDTTRQIGVVRIQLDLLAVKLAIIYASNADFVQMYQHSLLCLKAAEENDIAMRIKEDCAFHLDLSRISKNKQLYEFQQRTYLQIEFLQSWRPAYLEEPEEQHRQHEQLFNALLERNEEKASVLLTHHNIHFHDLEKYYPPEIFLKNNALDDIFNQ